MEIEIVKWFQSFGNDVLDVINCGLTQLGESGFFVCIFLFFYWCVGYKESFRFVLFYLTSVLINNVIKIFVKRPRPWMASGEVVNKLPASGFSFPSGHSQSIAAISTFLTVYVYKSKARNSVRILTLIISVVVSVVVALTRIYLGQHYLTDVLSGLCLGTLIMLVLFFLETQVCAKLAKIKPEYVLMLGSMVLLVLLTIVQFNNLSLDVNLIERIHIFCGFACGTTIGFLVCNNQVKNTVESVWQCATKLAIGYLVVGGLYFLLKLIPQTHMIMFLSMLVVSFVATCVYPIVYNLICNKFFNKGN